VKERKERKKGRKGRKEGIADCRLKDKGDKDIGGFLSLYRVERA
jgi:hypothetical protein